MSQVVQNHQQALNVLVQAAQTANKRGAFSLEESGVIASAVSVFMPPAPPETQTEAEDSDASEHTGEEQFINLSKNNYYLTIYRYINVVFGQARLAPASSRT